LELMSLPKTKQSLLVLVLPFIGLL